MFSNIKKIICEAVHQEAAGDLIDEASYKATEKILQLIEPIEADLRRAKCLVIYHDDGKVVTQGSFNACVCSQEALVATVEKMKKQLEEQTTAMKCVEAAARRMGWSESVNCAPWDYIQSEILNYYAAAQKKEKLCQENADAVKASIKTFSHELLELTKTTWNAADAETIHRLRKKLQDEKERTTQQIYDLRQCGDKIVEMRGRIAEQDAKSLLDNKVVKEKNDHIKVVTNITDNQAEKIRVLTDEIVAKNKEIADLQQGINERSLQLHESTVKIDSKNKEIVALEKQVKDYYSDLKEANNKILTLRDRVPSTNALKEELAKKDAEIARLNRTLDGRSPEPDSEEMSRTIKGLMPFLIHMESELLEADKDGKSGWEEASPHFLLSRLIEESAELVEASSEYRMIGLLSRQLSDLSNMIMCQEDDDKNVGDDEEPVFRKNIFRLANRKAIAKEAVDVANFAYFIWARCQENKS